MGQKGLYSTWPRPSGPHAGWPRQAAGGEEMAYYRIKLGTWLSPDWADWFDHISIQNLLDGSSLIEGPLTDQAALFGLLWQMGDLNLPLLSVERADVTWT